jgi:hypothetical protein
LQPVWSGLQAQALFLERVFPLSVLMHLQRGSEAQAPRKQGQAPPAQFAMPPVPQPVYPLLFLRCLAPLTVALVSPVLLPQGESAPYRIHSLSSAERHRTLSKGRLP